MRLKMLIAAILVVSIAGCSSTRKPSQKEIATKHWNAARADVLHSLARDQYNTGHFEKCRKTLEEALRLNPENANLHVLAGKLALEQGQLETAERSLKLANQLDARNAEADYLSGIIYQRWQKLELALECYHSASEKAPEELAYVLAQAEVLVIMDRLDQALALLRGKMSQFEYSAVIRDAVGQLLMQAGRHQEAVETLRHAMLLAEDEPTIREHLALALFHNKQYREAADLLTRLLTNERFYKRADLHIALAESQIQLGRISDARRTFETATQLSPNSPAAWLGVAKTAMQLNDQRRAELSVRKALSIDGANAESHLLLGYLRLRQDRMNDALTAFQKASALSPSDPVALCMIGYVMEKTGNGEQAFSYYARALQVKPGDEMAAKLLAAMDRD
jgi:Flp pilus assembly protein TadD